MKQLVRWVSKLRKYKNLHQVLAFLFCLSFVLAYILLTLNKYWQYEYFFVDNVYFDTALWKASQLQAPIVHHPIMGTINILGDHFHPTIFLFSVFYRLFPYTETIFILMSIVYGLGGYLAMLVGFKLLARKYFVYLLGFIYFTFIGIQNAFLFGFHEINLMPLFFFLMLYGYFFRRHVVYFVGLILLLLTKESLSVTVATFAIFIFLSDRSRWKQALATLIISAGAFLVTTQYLIPLIAQKKYFYSQTSIPTNLVAIYHKLFVPFDKVEAFLISMGSFAFLPLLNIATLPMVLGDFLIRYLFAIEGNVQYSLSYHYSLGFVPILFFSSVWSLMLLEKSKYLSRLLPIVGIGLFLIAIYMFRFFDLNGQRSPLLLVANADFYESTKSNYFLTELVNATPKEGKIMTQNHLGLRFSHQDVYPLSIDSRVFNSIDPDYIVYDMREGQNANNYFPIEQSDLKCLVDYLLSTQRYSYFYQNKSMNILKKNDASQHIAPTAELDPVCELNF